MRSKSKPRILITVTDVAAYNVTNAWTNAPGWAITVPRAGRYKITANLCLDARDTDGTNCDVRFRLAADSSSLGEPFGTYHVSNANNLGHIVNNYIAMNNTYLKKGQVITIQVYHAAGDNGAVPGVDTSMMELILL